MTIDVIRLAREAGFKASVGKTDLDGKYHPNVNALSKDVPVEWLERFAALVMEEDAKVCEARNTGDCSREDQESTLCAAAIRARKP